MWSRSGRAALGITSLLSRAPIRAARCRRLGRRERGLLCAGWALCVRRRRLGDAPGEPLRPALGLASLAWFLVELDNPEIGSALVFTVGLSDLRRALRWSRTRRSPTRAAGWVACERGVVVAATARLGVLLGFAAAAVFDPPRQGCSACPGNLVAVANDPELLATLHRAGVRLGVVWAAALIGSPSGGSCASSPARTARHRPVLLPLVAYLGLVGADYAHALGRGLVSNDAADERLWGLQAVALVRSAGASSRRGPAAAARARRSRGWSSSWPRALWPAGCATRSPGRSATRSSRSPMRWKAAATSTGAAIPST